MEEFGVVPTYEYKCNNCGDILEQWQRFSDSPLTECPACAGDLRRVIQAVGVVFKGSGWYSTDSRPNGKQEGKQAGKPEEKAEGKPEGKPEGKVEGKPEGKPEGKAEGKTEGNLGESKAKAEVAA
jgi:putative FmdB family regulatory protein